MGHLSEAFSPRRQLWVFDGVDWHDPIDRAQRRLAADVGYRQLVAAQELCVLEEALENGPTTRNVFHLFGVQIGRTVIDDRIKQHASAGKQIARVEMKARIDVSTLHQILGVQRVIFAVFVDQIRANGVAVVDEDTIVVE